ncbi:MAG: electron transfer flavoprotein subunit alpha/FixB family protein [Bergeyella cardium]
MTIFVYAENNNGSYKKTTFEAISFAKAIAESNGGNVTAITINPTDSVEKLYQYGADKVLTIKNEGLKFSPKAYSQILAEVAQSELIILPNTVDSSSIAPMLAVQKGFSIITNVTELPESLSPLRVKRKVFSGKAFATVQSETTGTVLTLATNSFGVKENPQSSAGTEEIINSTVQNTDVQVISTEQSIGKLDLKDADIVVSGGRGLKDAEHWHLIEELASALGGATACSKPVSDMGWRPHSEHVGQTGKTISPNLYIAAGISGAIQHLAGVNSSKTIVVINSDSEAPFFKAADYGVVGDVFRVLPELTKKIKEANT